MPAPKTNDRYIIAARLLGYLNEPEKAVALLTKALENDPENIRLLRFRGHRRITTRDFDGAISDLQAAAALLPGSEDEYELYQKDVQPDAIKLVVGDDDVNDHHPTISSLAGTPEAEKYMTTLHTAVWYHLAVALYVSGRLTEAVEAFSNAYRTAHHYEGKVASLDWKYMALRRLGRTEEAEQVLPEFVTLVEEYDPQGVGYHDRMELYTGKITPEQLAATISDNTLLIATVGYGLGNWYLYNGDVEKAKETFQGVLDTGASGAFAYIAVESERAGLGELANSPLHNN
ncbi:tetratricopeptide repeat protein [Bogoriella caseilytica]|uniref:Tetratricopeptide repeat protein n=1 Tax=Bogoriella caseilytica TaxID=56055 RepID=A0A3N2BE42_9MICO|nr:tetratricopeptide repeat protein [Bogoriella caseilytica]ROR73304.1 tetratricopeptide repeat protein [Bogoriella caseilytica]